MRARCSVSGAPSLFSRGLLGAGTGRTRTLRRWAAEPVMQGRCTGKNPTMLSVCKTVKDVVQRYVFCFRAVCATRVLAFEVLVTVMWCLAVVLVTHLMPDMENEIEVVSKTGSAMLTHILGTLLVFLITFRSSQAYSRWWEGR